LLGMTPTDQVVIAHVARYHRGGDPKPKHAAFAVLERPLREKITTLAAILRVADGLDRGHVAAVEGIRVRVTADTVRIAVQPVVGAMVRLECWGASRKRALLETVMRRQVVIVGPDGPTVDSEQDGDGDGE